MSFNKNGIVDFETLDEMAPRYYMKTKMLDDGSVWGRIHWLDVASTSTYFANSAEVAECLNQSNRFSLMGKVDDFRAAGELPKGYKKLDYIQSTGTQYIDTGYYWKHENVKIEMNALVASNSANQSLFGNEEPRSGGRYFAIVPHGINGSYAFYTGQTGSVGSAAVTINKRFQMECFTTATKTLTVIIDGVKKFTATYPGTIMTYANTTSTNAYKGRFFIFANHNSGNDGANPCQHIGGMRLYSFKMWDNDVMVRNFIPCKNDSDIAGLYDTITKTFFTTPVGTFTAGPVLQNAEVPNYGDFEFMLTYPRLSSTLYNRWKQSGSPHEETPGGYVRITTAWTTHAGPIRRANSGSSVYNCDNVGSDTWFAAIGQIAPWSGTTAAIPAANSTNTSNSQKETELWVRLDTLASETIRKITSPGFYESGESSDIARIVESKELHSAHFIES